MANREERTDSFRSVDPNGNVVDLFTFTRVKVVEELAGQVSKGPGKTRHRMKNGDWTNEEIDGTFTLKDGRNVSRV